MAGIYIHIPFCKQACNYCNFHFSTTHHLIPKLIKAIAREAEQRKNYLTEIVDTIYFGGGTPSILNHSQIEFLLNNLKNNFTVNLNAEISLEANPDDITEENLLAWKKIGINRFSLGIQSFIDDELIWMNRSHNSTQAKKSIELIKNNFDNYSIDLIFGSQLLTNEQWKKNIETALSFNPPHLSCYALTVESKTLLGKSVETEKIDNIDNNKQAEQFEYLMNCLEARGYHQYEISNYSKPNFESRHNSSYWQGKHYLGLGPSAHSFNIVSRSWNISNNNLYINLIDKNELVSETETLTETQQLNEYIMISLRTSKGIDLNFVKVNFGKTIFNSIINNSNKWQNSGHIFTQNNFLILSKRGKLIADNIASDLFF